jgi:hypothetical protein
MHAMKSRHFLGFLLLTAIAWLLPAESRAAGENSKIEGLISQVENLKDAKFIRNGSTYDSKDAAKFLRSKWRSKEKEIKTADDFIEKVATASSTTGKSYLIRFNDGREMKCADYLKKQLEK